MKAKFPAMALALAAALGISVSSCAAPAPSGPAAPPAASAAAAQLPQAGGNVQAGAPNAIPTAEAPAPAGPDYKAIYSKLLGGNVPNKERVFLAKPAKNQDNTFGPMDWCFLAYGGKVQATDTSGVFKYSYPFETGYVTCPDGIEFIMTDGSLYDIEGNRAKTEVVDAKFKQDLELASKMPAFSGPTTSGEAPLMGLVRVMTLAPISNTDKTFVFWSTCSVKDYDSGHFTGKIEVLGKTSVGTTFARFSSSRPRTGGECPSGTIFVLEDQAGLDGMPLYTYDDGMRNF